MNIRISSLDFKRGLRMLIEHPGLSMIGALAENHDVWTPLGMDAVDYDRGETPLVTIFGRLAPGYTRGEAREEVTGFRLRHAGDFPRTYERKGAHHHALYRRGLRRTDATRGLLGVPILRGAHGRRLRRRWRADVRAHRGATRRDHRGERVGGEPGPAHDAVLGGGAPARCAGRGGRLVAVYLGKPWGTDLFMRAFEQPRACFWWDRGLATGTVLYAAGLAVLGAAFAGVLPALTMICRRD